MIGVGSILKLNVLEYGLIEPFYARWQHMAFGILSSLAIPLVMEREAEKMSFCQFQ